MFKSQTNEITLIEKCIISKSLLHLNFLPNNIKPTILNDRNNKVTTINLLHIQIHIKIDPIMSSHYLPDTHSFISITQHTIHKITYPILNLQIRYSTLLNNNILKRIPQ